MNTMEDTSGAPPHFVTFYSFKGGTGRSMLLANVAWLLATNGERVLIVDWDLEAPGLHRYFHPFLTDQSFTETDGLIDALGQFVEAAVSGSQSVSEEEVSGGVPEDDPNWYKVYANLQSYSVPIKWSFKGNGKIDLIGAGRQGPMYGATVNLFDWKQFYLDFAGSAFLETAKQLLHGKYDYVLIDSRTGVSDTSGICTKEMPDTLVVCFTLNDQSIEGAYSVAADAAQSRANGAALDVIPVPTRIDTAESDRLELGRELARFRFRSLVPLGTLPPNASEDMQIDKYWGEVEVPYVPKYAYEELLACFSDKLQLPSSVLRAAENVAGLLRGRPTEMVVVPEEKRLDVLKQYARKPYKVKLAEEYAVRLSAPDLDVLRKVLVRLVQVAPANGSRVSDVSCACSLHDFTGEGESSMLAKAEDHKVVTIVRDANDQETVKLSDSRLITLWSRLAEWIDSDRAFLAWLPQLNQARQMWIGSGMLAEDLLTGTSLADAVRWLQTRRTELRPVEIDFIEKCRLSDEMVRTAAEAELKDVGVQRKVQSLQSEAVREQLEAKDLELRQATVAYEKLSASHTPRKNYLWPLLTIVFGMITALLSAYFVWHKHMAVPAAAPPPPLSNLPARPVDNPKGPKPSDPHVDTGSDISKVQKVCAGITLNLYANSVRRQADQQALIKLWTQYGLKTQMITVGSRAQPANSIWHGSDVPDGCWRVVAFSMTRAGVYVSDLGSPEHDVTGKHQSIDIGYSARGLSIPPLYSANGGPSTF